MAEEKKTPKSSNEEAVKEAVREAREEAKKQEKAGENREAEVEEETAGPEDIEEAVRTEADGETGREADSPTRDAAEAADTAEADPGPKESGKETSHKKKDPRDEKIAELTDRVTRQMAEFDNFRKRTEKEKNASFELGASSIVEKILPVVDNFERGLGLVPEGEVDAFAEGMDKIYKQLVTTLTDLGVSPIEALGQTFDPQLHNAVMHVEDENFGESEIVEELQKGYKFHDRVIRHSMVKVAN